MTNELAHPDDPPYVIRLSSAQRKVAAKVAPHLADHFILEESGARPVTLTSSEVQLVLAAARGARRNHRGMERNSLDVIGGLLSTALEARQGIGAIPPKTRVYQFRIALRHIHPVIWRRVQTRNCTLDRLHEVIQLAMGWTNSHLHEFTISGVPYGDPMLLEEGDDYKFRDSRRTYLVDIVPQSGAQFQFDYRYDFGDHWEHTVDFERCLSAEEGVRYPRCIGGERACPPEDVGGPTGFAEYCKIMSNPRGRKYLEFVEWNGPFDANAFDLEATNRRIKRGLPDWRKEMVEAYWAKQRDTAGQPE